MECVFRGWKESAGVREKAKGRGTNRHGATKGELLRRAVLMVVRRTLDFSPTAASLRPSSESFVQTHPIKSACPWITQSMQKALVKTKSEAILPHLGESCRCVAASPSSTNST